MANGTAPDKENLQKCCPFLNEECIGEKCALHSELRSAGGGLQRTFGTCSFTAVVLILSEINQKTMMGQQRQIQLPQGFLRGSQKGI